MATAQCPSCGLTVPYFCCEGLVCPACGYDEEQHVTPEQASSESDSTSDAFHQALPPHLPHSH